MILKMVSGVGEQEKPRWLCTNFHLGFGVVLLEQKPVNDADWISTNASNSSDARTGQDSSGEEDSDDEEPNNSTIEVSSHFEEKLDFSCNFQSFSTLDVICQF